MRYRLGMVLSGGGARGIAHIGVLAALAEHDLAPDCLAGTSSGAIVGAFYAAGHSFESMLEFFATRSPFKLTKLSLGKPGLIDTNKIRCDFQHYFPDDSFAALDKRLFVTATDLVNARPVILESGSLISAILASSSVPMVFTPTEINGRWYSDGGIINNFPVDTLTGLCDVTVGVYATTLRELQKADLSNSLAVSLRAFEVGMYFNSKKKFHQCDVLISPTELRQYPAFDTKHVREIYDIGYRAATAKIGAIEEALRAVT